MTDRTAADDWFRRYRAAWESNEPDDIRGLFTEDAVYRGSPSGTAWEGADEIVEKWLENRDEPGETEFEWRVLAVDGEVAIAQCVSTYFDDGAVVVYDNLFVVRLTDDGRATEYTDWWIKRRPPGDD